MDLLKFGWNWAWNQWDIFIDLSDPRVSNWLFMENPLPTAGLTLLYLLMVLTGPKFMHDRKPLESRSILFLYNAFLVVLNFHIFKELVIAAKGAHYSYLCQSISYSTDPYHLRIASALWWYYFSKCIEFFDTFFFILRKKNCQITFLHVYHHATMFPIWWVGIKWSASGQAFFGATINSFIHIVMYSYYGLAAFGPEMRKYLWWKRYLTRLQLIQFIVGMLHAVQSIIMGCDYPLWMQLCLIAYGITILALFLNFYIQAYIRPDQDKTVTKSNGHANGFITANGSTNHKQEKKRKR